LIVVDLLVHLDFLTWSALLDTEFFLEYHACVVTASSMQPGVPWIMDIVRKRYMIDDINLSVSLQLFHSFDFQLDNLFQNIFRMYIKQLGHMLSGMFHTNC
jgi:hypothetical protein